MQLHVLGTLLLVALLRCRRAALPALLALLAASMAAAGALVWRQDLQPMIAAQAPE